MAGLGGTCLITKRTVKMHRYDEREIEIYREREKKDQRSN